MTITGRSFAAGAAGLATAGVTASGLAGGAKGRKNAFRLAPLNVQCDDAVRNACLKILKINEVGIFGASTGYGTSAVKSSVAGFTKENAKIVYSGVIDPDQSDLTPDLLRMRDAGAKALVCRSVTTGLNQSTG